MNGHSAWWCWIYPSTCTMYYIFPSKIMASIRQYLKQWNWLWHWWRVHWVIGLSLPTTYQSQMDAKFSLHSVCIKIYSMKWNTYIKAVDVISILIKIGTLSVRSISASIFTGVFIVAASYAECDQFYAVACFTISIAFQGVPGVAINTLDLSPNYAGILMGIGGTLTSITGIIVPYTVGLATPNVSSIRYICVECIT